MGDFLRITKRHASKRGVLLVELLVALSVLTIGFMGIFTLLIRSTGLSRTVTDNYITTYLASEGIEIMKYYIDTNYNLASPSWNIGIEDNATYEVDYRAIEAAVDLAPITPGSERFIQFDPGKKFYGYFGNDSWATKFKRTVQTKFIYDVNGNANAMKITALVFWQDRGAARSIQMEDHFYNWR